MVRKVMVRKRVSFGLDRVAGCWCSREGGRRERVVQRGECVVEGVELVQLCLLPVAVMVVLMGEE